MRLNPQSDESRAPDPDAYWRRRVFILGGGLAVLAVLAWLFSGGPSTSASRAAAAHASAAARATRTQLPAAAYGSPSVSPQPSPSGSVSAALTPSVSPGAAGSAAVPGLPGASGSAAATAQGTAASAPCPAGGIVISLFTSQASYSPGQEPTFNVYAVSTAAAQCDLTFGASAVRVIVTRNGQVVWDSAACKTPVPRARPVLFEQGVPQVATLSWNRKAANQGCAGSIPAGTWGTFSAVAMSDGRSSAVRSFKLTRA